MQGNVSGCRFKFFRAEPLLKLVTTPTPPPKCDDHRVRFYVQSWNNLSVGFSGERRLRRVWDQRIEMKVESVLLALSSPTMVKNCYSLLFIYFTIIIYSLMHLA